MLWQSVWCIAQKVLLCSFAFTSCFMWAMFFGCLALIHYIKASRRLCGGFAECRVAYEENSFPAGACAEASRTYYDWKATCRSLRGENEFKKERCSCDFYKLGLSNRTLQGTAKKHCATLRFGEGFSSVDLILHVESGQQYTFLWLFDSPKKCRGSDMQEGNL